MSQAEPRRPARSPRRLPGGGGLAGGSMSPRLRPARVAWLCAALLALPAAGATFPLPTDDTTVVGRLRVVAPSGDNTLLDIARHFDVGVDEIAWANPGISPWTPGHLTRVLVPGSFIMPPGPWQGIVINIPQRRLYFFPVAGRGQDRRVITYPVSIAREGWSTPLGSTRIVNKYKDPGWLVPKSIQAEHREEEGVEMPTYFPPGPDNPMGMLALRTGFPGIFIHATNHPWGVGMRTSHGCIHLYPEDAAELFPLVAVGTPVRFIDEALVVGDEQGVPVAAAFPRIAEYGRGSSRAAARLPAEQLDKVFAVAQPVTLPLGVESPGEWLASLPVERYDFPPYDMDANNAALPGRRRAGRAAMNESIDENE